MKKIQNKNKFLLIIQSKPMLIFFGLVILFFAWNVTRFMGKMRETVKIRRLEEQKISELRDRKAYMEANIAKLKTDKGIEEKIREKFGLSKDGEELVVVVEDLNQEISSSSKKSNRFFSFLKNLFK